MDNKITMTEREAYTMYLDYGYEDVVPFKAKGQTDFLDWLKSIGWEIIDDKDRECRNI